jgi:penicillin-insensitive murein endopeptidase
MRTRRRLAGRGAALLAAWAVPWSAAWAAGNGWSEVSRPSAGAPRVIGTYVSGCIGGAAALPLVGDGYQVMRPGRNRYYGHPRLVALLERMGRETAKDGGRLLVGDLAQPRGGPMPSGHRSHQSGLDADVWYVRQADGRVLSTAEADQAAPKSVVRAAEGVPDERLWASFDPAALRLAARSPEVERIFVNPVVKKALCAAESDREWLAKLRPWWGHDEHFHVRLACPAGAADCAAQDAVPPGDGCDADLDRWVEEQRQAAISPESVRRAKPAAPPAMPVACSAVLSAAPKASRR